MLARSRNGSVSVMVAVMAPSLIALAALLLDGGLWMTERARLQIAADAAANGAGYLLLDTALQSQSATAQQAAFQSVALAGARDAAGTLVGTLGTPDVTVAADWRSVSVTLHSQADSFLAGALGIGAPALSASATSSLGPLGACVIALNPSAAQAIRIDNMGGIVASGCGIQSDSDAGNAIYLNSGTLDAPRIAAVGAFAESNSGSNDVKGSTPISGASIVADPYAGEAPPTPGACSYTNASFTAWQSQPYSFTQTKNVFCGNTTIGGNGTTDTFEPGIYYVVNGNLVFNNAAISQADGVSFVLAGTNPGAFEWTNYSNTYTLTAPTTGPTAGILVWQECPASGSAPASTMNGGSTLQVSGVIYAPCGAWNMNNNAHLTTAPGGTMSVVASTMYMAGSAGLAAAGSNSGGGSAVRPHLTQ